jgi:inosose dehydratase
VSRERIAGAPVSWGVIEIPDWGYQMPADRVLKEASSLGLSAIEAGPEGLLPADPAEVSDLLSGYDLKLVGGFVPAVISEPGAREQELARVEERAEFFAAAEADVVVLAAMPASEDVGKFVEIDGDAWRTLFESLRSVEEICARHGVEVSLHPHYGTVIERDDQLKRFLEGSEMSLCLDTGHLVIGGSDPVEIAALAGDRVNHVHLKDVDTGVVEKLASRELSFREAAEEDAFRPLATATWTSVGWWISSKARATGGWYVLEQDSVVEAEPREGEGPMVEVGKSLRFLQARLGGLR